MNKELYGFCYNPRRNGRGGVRKSAQVESPTELMTPLIVWALVNRKLGLEQPADVEMGETQDADDIGRDTAVKVLPVEAQASDGEAVGQEATI